MKKYLLFFLASTSVLLPSTSKAEFKRDRLLIGFAANISDIEDKKIIGNNDRNVGMGLNFYLGGSLTDDFALMGLVDVHVGNATVLGEDATLSVGFAGPVAQYSIDKLNLRGGLGSVSTQAEVTVGNVKYSANRDGFGIYLSPTYDVLRGKEDFALDVNLKFIPQWYASNKGGFAYVIGGGLGFTWY
jgi:hypothetical protein